MADRTSPRIPPPQLAGADPMPSAGQEGDRSVPETCFRGTTAALPKTWMQASYRARKRTEIPRKRPAHLSLSATREAGIHRKCRPGERTHFPQRRGILKGSDSPADPLRASVWSVRSKTAALLKKQMLNRPSRNVAQGGMRPSVFRVETAAAPHAKGEERGMIFFAPRGRTPRDGVSRS